LNPASLPTGETEYLVDTGLLIHQLSAERDLVEINIARPIGDGLLALSNPAFNEIDTFAAPTDDEAISVAHMRGTRSACGQFAELQFQPLPATAHETDEIVALWDDRIDADQRERHKPDRATARTSGALALLTGSDATERAFKSEAGGKRVLHLATHGFFLGGCHPVLNSEHSVPADTYENPLLLSGLALAGANNRDKAGANNEDGILTAEEIAALDLRGAEWAVLSACDTGIGTIEQGEGVLGLRRAFQIAGVRTLIMSLWPVEDESARNWMQGLYSSRFGQGLNTAESVRSASLQLLNARRVSGQSTHPFFWAAFVAVGDWR
jgi:CHAT domain-containing protein